MPKTPIRDAEGELRRLLAVSKVLRDKSNLLHDRFVTLAKQVDAREPKEKDEKKRSQVTDSRP
jgi:hypothetical protein